MSSEEGETDADRFRAWLNAKIGGAGQPTPAEFAVALGIYGNPSAVSRWRSAVRPSRPSYEHARAAGVALDDVAGALGAAGYESDEAYTGNPTPVREKTADGAMLIWDLPDDIRESVERHVTLAQELAAARKRGRGRAKG